jgi:Sep15/SelM redox domain.
VHARDYYLGMVFVVYGILQIFVLYPFWFSAFVKSDRPAKFPNLQIKYVRGLDPIIKLMDKDGNVQDVSGVSSIHTVVHVVFMFMQIFSVTETFLVMRGL